MFDYREEYGVVFPMIHMYKQALLEFSVQVGFVLSLEGFFHSCPLIYMEICILLFDIIDF